MVISTFIVNFRLSLWLHSTHGRKRNLLFSFKKWLTSINNFLFYSQTFIVHGPYYKKCFKAPKVLTFRGISSDVTSASLHYNKGALVRHKVLKKLLLHNKWKQNLLVWRSILKLISTKIKGFDTNCGNYKKIFDV